jgi:hypothetical protein
MTFNMKRFLLWSFDRGSIQYDVICGLILAFIFLTPGHAFNDRPAYMQVSASDLMVKKTDVNGSEVYTVKLGSAVLWDSAEHREAALDSLRKYLKAPVTMIKMQPVYTTTGMTVAYAIWIDPLEGN